ncbi:hypothetical protein E4U56_003375 [Claviceps arundinis]|uniref:Uncharacterized protein n=1 Tax=Claviceps arundinis TaxID=1623583 RepID=A0A9P7MN23_9HYPO|nr:hypothetical protein E4U56_003375 [Claviceps arundinis]
MATGKRVRRKRELVATVSNRNRTQKAEVRKLWMAVVAAEIRGLGVDTGQGILDWNCTSLFSRFGKNQEELIQMVRSWPYSLSRQAMKLY